MALWHTVYLNVIGDRASNATTTAECIDPTPQYASHVCVIRPLPNEPGTNKWQQSGDSRAY